LPGWAWAARPGLLLLTGVLLVGLCALLARCQAGPQPDPAGFDLLAAGSSFKLKDAGTGQPPAPPAQLSVVAAVEEEPKPALPAKPEPVPESKVPAPVIDVPAPVESPRLLDPPAVVPQPPPEDPAFLDALHQGDLPMIRHWLTLGWTPLLAAVMTAPLPLVVQTAHAEAGGTAAKKNNDGPAPAPDTTKALADLTKLVRALRKEVGDLASDVRAMKNVHQLDQQATKEALDKVADDRQATADAFGRVAKDMAALKNQLADLRRELNDVRQRAASASTSAYGPAAPANTARIQMVNRYHVPMKVLINKKSYLVRPGETLLSEPIPAGAFTYEIFQDPGDGAIVPVTPGPRQRTVAINGTHVLTIHPQGL
jgi:hypothetical protein